MTFSIKFSNFGYTVYDQNNYNTISSYYIFRQYHLMFYIKQRFCHLVKNKSKLFGYSALRYKNNYKGMLYYRYLHYLYYIVILSIQQHICFHSDQSCDYMGCRLYNVLNTAGCNLGHTILLYILLLRKHLNFCAKYLQCLFKVYKYN